MEIVKIPAQILKKRLKPLSLGGFEGAKLAELAEQMHQTMVAANGVGLAANQVGKDMQLFVIDRNLAQENGVPDAFINPEITEQSKDTDEMEEGCLSIPEFYTPIRRSKKVKIKALTLAGEKIKFKARGFLARVLQHETDHLNGITIKQRMGKKNPRRAGV